MLEGNGGDGSCRVMLMLDMKPTHFVCLLCVGTSGLLPWGSNYSVILIFTEAGDKVVFLLGRPFANEFYFSKGIVYVLQSKR